MVWSTSGWFRMSAGLCQLPTHCTKSCVSHNWVSQWDSVKAFLLALKCLINYYLSMVLVMNLNHSTIWTAMKKIMLAKYTLLPVPFLLSLSFPFFQELLLQNAMILTLLLLVIQCILMHANFAYNFSFLDQTAGSLFSKYKLIGTNIPMPSRQIQCKSTCSSFITQVFPEIAHKYQQGHSFSETGA